MSFEPLNTDNSTRAKYEELSKERKDLQDQGHLPSWYTTAAWQMFKEKYKAPDEIALYDRHKAIAKRTASYLPEGFREDYEQLFFDMMWNNILSPASPTLSNTGTTVNRGLGVSCSGQVIGDSIDSFYTNLRETALLSKQAFGTSGDFSTIRHKGAPISKGGKANGIKEVIEDFFTAGSKVSQGGNRRGSFAAYVDIEHPDFDICLESLRQTPDGKNYGWVLKDTFIERLKAGEPIAMQRFTDALHTKLITGKGYMFFPDKANRHRPQMYKDLGLDIVATNLCTEIMLHSSEEYSFSCILASLNLIHWDVIKDSNYVFAATVFLDCLCSDFLHEAKDIPGMEKVVKFTEKGRAIGLGTMGFHTYLQQNMIAFESLEAQFLNKEIFKHISSEALRASQWLAEVLGEPEWCTGYGVRNTHRTAQAPTKSTSLLMGGVSEGISPDPAMVFEAASAVGGLTRITPVIYELMKDRGVYNEETVNNIIENLGSVQHVDWLTPEEKLVFKTAFEINQDVILRYASQRQPFLCQGQSLNFFIPGEESEELISDLMTKVIMDPNILSQYYIYSRSGVVVTDECIACQA